MDVPALTELGQWLVNTFGLWGAVVLAILGVAGFVAWRIRADRREDQKIDELRLSYEKRIAELRADIDWYRHFIASHVLIADLGSMKLLRGGDADTALISPVYAQQEPATEQEGR